MATRHERRRKAKALQAVKARKDIVRANLSAPSDHVSIRGSLVSGVYRGGQDRARGMGVAPMHHIVSAVFTDRPHVARLLYPDGTKIYRNKRD